MLRLPAEEPAPRPKPPALERDSPNDGELRLPTGVPGFTWFEEVHGVEGEAQLGTGIPAAATAEPTGPVATRPAAESARAAPEPAASTAVSARASAGWRTAAGAVAPGIGQRCRGPHAAEADDLADAQVEREEARAVAEVPGTIASPAAAWG